MKRMKLFWFLLLLTVLFFLPAPVHASGLIDFQDAVVLSASDSVVDLNLPNELALADSPKKEAAPKLEKEPIAKPKEAPKPKAHHHHKPHHQPQAYCCTATVHKTFRSGCRGRLVVRFRERPHRIRNWFRHRPHRFFGRRGGCG